ncbi:TonB-dependent receptor [Salinibacter altiplanensis]|uniref:TonB-dependent receptor n=1 Tax=Salinibacter altiplanensis TaxID=1803181 RepID=UPI001F24720B
MPTGSYVTLDLQDGTELGRGASLEVGANNLTDTDYVNHLNASNPYSGMPIPEPGRVVSTTLMISL